MRYVFERAGVLRLVVAFLLCGGGPAQGAHLDDAVWSHLQAVGAEASSENEFRTLCGGEASGHECLILLRRSYTKLQSPEADSLRLAKRRDLAHTLAEEIVRLQGMTLPAGAIPARFRPLGNGQLVHLEPNIALAPGLIYEMVLEGLPVLALQTAPQGPEEIRSALQASLQEASRGRVVTERELSLGGLQLGLERQAESADGVPALAGVRLLLEHTLSVAELEKLRVGFVPATTAPPRGNLAVADSVAQLRAKYAEMDNLPCAPVALRADRAAPGAQQWRGKFPSLDERGVPVWLPFLIALPDFGKDPVDIVFLVDGLGGSMERFLSDQVSSLRARGLGVVAVELPAHGRRSEGHAYLAPEDPAALATILPRGALDVAAAIRQVRACGLRLPEEGRPRIGAVHYLGYSLGGMTGVLVRAVVPEIDRMVLLAPSADLADWLLLHAIARSGVPMVICVGGADSGKSCLGHGRCAVGGACMIDPLMAAAGRHLRWAWQVAGSGADPSDYANRPAGGVDLLILSGAKDGILAPRQTYRLAEALGMRPLGPHLWVGENSRLEEFPELDHSLVDDPAVRERLQDFLANRS